MIIKEPVQPILSCLVKCLPNKNYVICASFPLMLVLPFRFGWSIIQIFLRNICISDFAYLWYVFLLFKINQLINKYLNCVSVCPRRRNIIVAITFADNGNSCEQSVLLTLLLVEIDYIVWNTYCSYLNYILYNIRYNI